MKSFLSALLALGLFCNDSSACSCPDKSFNEFVSGADAIYLATLEEAKIVKGDHNSKWPFIQGRFVVRQTLKGHFRTGDMTLQTGLGGGDCGVTMSVAKIYIIFKKANMDGINDCDGSHGIYNFEVDDVAAKVKAVTGKTPFKN